MGLEVAGEAGGVGPVSGVVARSTRTGMKSATSPTPSGDTNRVMSTGVSGKPAVAARTP